jgi:hypothetical protein
MASAITVSIGLMPIGPGNRLASATISPGTPWKPTEAAGHAAPRVLAHPRGAHQVDREELKGPLRHRPGQQTVQLVRAADDRGAVDRQ